MRKLTTQEFIEKAKKVHGNKYDYSKVNYIDARSKIIIICPEHGEFEQTPNSHLNGRGCPKCGNIVAANKNKNTKEEFINKANKVHGNKYDYSLVDYKNSKTPVIIICPEHGQFTQTPTAHLSGQGCTKCYREKQSVLFRDSAKIFIEKAKQIHGDKYDYSKVNYVNNNTKVTIVCPIHGEFKQTPGHHKSGQGCPKCGNLKKFVKNIGLISKGEKQIMSWLENNKIQYQYNKPIEIYKKLIRVDFVLNDNCFIEYNGIQHYQRVPFFHKTDMDYLKQQYRDQLLRKYCTENNITLIEINYKQDVNNILNDKFKNAK